MSRDLGRRGLGTILASATVAALVGLARWLGDDVPLTASSRLLWAGCAVAGALWIVGLLSCLVSILYNEGSTGRARAGIAIGALAVAAVAAYAGNGGFDEIDVAPAAPPVGITSVSPGPVDAGDGPDEAADDVYINEEYHFSVDGPGLPGGLADEETEGWDAGVRFREIGPGTALWIDVLASDHGPQADDSAGVDQWLEDTGSRYEGSGMSPSRVTLREVNGRPCALALSRTRDLQSGDSVVIADYWIAGDGFSYLVRGFAYAEDWRRVRSRLKEVVGSFETW